MSCIFCPPIMNFNKRIIKSPKLYFYDVGGESVLSRTLFYGGKENQKRHDVDIFSYREVGAFYNKILS